MLSFIPSPDVMVILNALLDLLEHRKKPSERSVKISLADLNLPGYFSQIDPTPRVTVNEQLHTLENAGIIDLCWLPGETGHLLHSVALPTEHATHIYQLIRRSAKQDQLTHLETLLLADQFRFPKDDWRARALRHTINQLRAGKSPTPFSLSDSAWNLDLLTVLAALPQLAAETPYRVFSVHTFNDSKRFDDLKPALIRLARRANPEWKTLSAEDLFRELNLVANPGYIHLAGNWQLTTRSGEILSLGGFSPSIGFPAAQVEAIQSVIVHADSVLCIENLTSFHEFLRYQTPSERNKPYATICLMGNPAPAIRRLLQIIPDTTPIQLWSDLDYGGFNILSQLRKQVRPEVQPWLMDIPTFEKHLRLSRPLSATDARNLRHLCTRPELADVQPTIKDLLQHGLKLEQEAIQI